MYSTVVKSNKASQSRAVANRVADKQTGGSDINTFTDNRSEAKQAAQLKAIITGSKASSPVYQFAGAYEGRMARHDTYGDSYSFEGGTKKEFTYHHIIPENKIHDVLKKIAAVVDDQDEVKNLKTRIADHAKIQFIDARATDTAFFITKELSAYKTEPVLTIGKQEAKAEIEKTEDKDTILKAFRDLLLKKLEELPPHTLEGTPKEREDLESYIQGEEFGRELVKYALPGFEDNFTEGAVWMPGNIHRGPKGSSRLDPKNKKQFDQWLDDGGNSFEKAAANLVSVDHFKKLWTLNGEIDKLIKLKDPVDGVDDLKDIKAFRDQAAKVLTQMDEIRRLGTTAFDETQWEEKTVPKKKGYKENFMRLKEHVPGLNDEKRLEEAKKLPGILD